MAAVWGVDSGAGQVEKVAYKEDAAAELVDKENAEAEDVDMAWVAYPAAVQILEEVPLLRLRILTLADMAHACASHMVSQRNNIDSPHSKPAVWQEGLLAASVFWRCGKRHRWLFVILGTRTTQFFYFLSTLSLKFSTCGRRHRWLLLIFL